MTNILNELKTNEKQRKLINDQLKRDKEIFISEIKSGLGEKILNDFDELKKNKKVTLLGILKKIFK